MKLFSLTVIVAILVLDILAIIFKSKAKNVYPLKWIKAFCTCLVFAGSLVLVSQYVWYGAVKGRVIEAFLWSSIALAVFSVYIFIKHIVIKDKPLGIKILNYALFYGSIWCLRYAVGYYEIATDPSVGLAWWDEIFNSLIHTLQTMSLDEDYTHYIAVGKEMMSALGLGEFGSLYGLYASALNTLAPIVGGLIIFEVIANIFTNIKIWFLNLDILRHKYYFSELNERSLALAKSIRDSHGTLFAPTCIFTDAYADGGNESMTELITEAKSSSFICVNEDLVHVKKPFLGKKTYFIIDENEAANLHTLADLTSGRNKKYVMSRFAGVPILNSEVKIYVFSTEDISACKIQAVKSLTALPEIDLTGLAENKRACIQTRLEIKQKKLDAACPIITVVNSYRNLMVNLFVEMPLYEPLVGSKQKTLNVTVLGSGLIGTEAVLEAYWIGQMLDRELNINVISQEDEKSFLEKLDYINPEIRMSMEKDNHVLIYHAESKKYTSPYAKLTYVCADVKNGILGGLDEDEEKAKIIAETDYFIVALGTDMDNISVAEKLRVRLGSNMRNCGIGKRTVISYAVYDSDLCQVLNSREKDESAHDVFMYAFGALNKVYSCENIFMSDHALLAASAQKGYAKARPSERKIMQKDDTDYTLWANLARAIHARYKVFSLGWITRSVIDYSVTERNSQTDEAMGRYIRICACGADAFQGDPYADEIKKKSVELAWLEHRRWNAFGRVMGYRSLKSCDAQGNHKAPTLKLHGCIKECAPEFETKPGYYDELDLISRERYEKKNGKQATENDPSGFKKYDYPWYEFGDYMTLENASEKLGISKERLYKRCEAGRIYGVIPYSADMNEKSYLIPTSYVKKGR